MKAKHFRDLQVWQRSMSLARSVYGLTAVLPQSEVFGLTQQMRRAAVSVPSKIAEGHGRLSDKSFALFLSQARGSLNELETQLELSIQMGFIQTAECSTTLQEIGELARMLNSLLTTVRQPWRGPRW
jgi:four helix bundle protein